MSGEDENRLDPAVVAALYVEHGEELRRFVLGVLRDTHLTNDVLQATFTKLVEVGHSSRVESRKSWLFRVAYNEAMLIRRKQGVGNRVLEKLAWSHRQSQEGEDRADELVIRYEVVQKIREAMQQLPPAQLEVLRMRIYEEKTFAVIAAELNIPLGTALARMHAALGKLSESLRQV